MEGYDDPQSPYRPYTFFDEILSSSSGPVRELVDTIGSGFQLPGFSVFNGGYDSYAPSGGLGSGLLDPYLGEWTGIPGRLAQAGQALAAPKPAALPGASGQIGVPSTRETRIARKIIEAFSRRSMDPDFALWVAENEGGLDDAAANRRNRQGSMAFGPYQLLIGGGLGDAAIQAGIDPRDPNSWERQIEFVADYVARNGWQAWEAVTARGIDPWTGTPGRGGYAGPRVAQTQPQLPAQAAVRTSAPGTTGSSYAQYSTTPAAEYTIAFDFDQPYGSSQFNVNIPRHRGIDLTVRGAPNGGRGSRVGAFHSGTVAALTVDPNGGNGVIILGDDGLYHRYFHMDSILAQQGQRIERGMPLGILGASGTEGFPHLHYEVSRRMDGDPMNQLIDPRPYLRGAF